ncbi:MAG: iron transporter [Thermodesulfobacteriota bacterium]
MLKKIFFIFLLVTSFNIQAYAAELIIGEERVKPGIVFIFEGAVKDQVKPATLHLPEKETHVHIEARVNWDTKDIPKGTPQGGFVPYLYITAKVTNQKTSLSTFVDLTPHINLVDNFHYARNISLPGPVDDLYTVVFTVTPPSDTDLALHKDWVDSYGNALMKSAVFEYKDVDFEEIANATRR